MTAQDNLQPKQFGTYIPPLHPQDFKGTLFHGTEAELSPGDMIKPVGKGSIPRHPAPDLRQARRQSQFAFATKRVDDADGFGPHVYEVEPLGNLRPDSYDNSLDYSSNSVMSRHGFRVTGKLPPPDEDY